MTEPGTTYQNNKNSVSSAFPYGDNFRERIVSVSRRRVGDIDNNPRNPKRPSETKQARLSAALSQFGKAGVLLTYLDDSGVERFFDGNTRRNLGPDEVWYIAQTDMTQAEVDGLVMFYDPLAVPDWDAELLKMLAEETAVSGDVLPEMLEEILAELAAEQLPDTWPEYDESAADDVEYLECPECGHKWPK